jgi:hypothetical protein
VAFKVESTVSPSAIHDSIDIRESGNPVVKAAMKPGHAALSSGSFAPDKYVRKSALRTARSVFRSRSLNTLIQQWFRLLSRSPDFLHLHIPPEPPAAARLVTLDDVGGERPLVEYTFNHTHTLPDPGAW